MDCEEIHVKVMCEKSMQEEKHIFIQLENNRKNMNIFFMFMMK